LPEPSITKSSIVSTGAKTVIEGWEYQIVSFTSCTSRSNEVLYPSGHSFAMEKTYGTEPVAESPEGMLPYQLESTEIPM